VGTLDQARKGEVRYVHVVIIGGRNVAEVAFLLFVSREGVPLVIDILEPQPPAYFDQ